MKPKEFRDPPSDGEQLHLILEYMGKIANERNVDQLLVLLADMGRDLAVADRATVWLIDEETRELWSKVGHGIGTIRISMEEGIAGYVARNGEPEVINDPYNDERFDKEVDKKTGYRTRSIIALPFRDSEGEIIGVFQAVNKMTSDGMFSKKDLNLLQVAAISTGKQLESALLQQELETTQKEVIFTFAEAGELRSKETGNHVKRVAEYSALLGRLAGMSDQEAELVKLASPLHDIGKIAIPDAILLKPGKLDEKEWKIMKTHAALGYDIFKQSKRRILRAASVIAHEHHEKWAGGGYPRGLAGEDIHIYGRITAIADVFDALASDRCYKKAWEMDKILDLFRDERGKQFDPNLVDCFLKEFDSFLEIKKIYRDQYLTEENS
jgi:response regulator RpfG family c-di-GMP phosphodiesterase